MQVRQFSPLLALRSVYQSARFMAKLPQPTGVPVEAECQHSSLSCGRPGNQLPYEQLMAEYRELEAKCKILRMALHQTSKRWQTQSPKQPCCYTQRTLVECPPGKLHLKKTRIEPRKKYPCLNTVFLCKVLAEELRRKKP